MMDDLLSQSSLASLSRCLPGLCLLWVATMAYGQEDVQLVRQRPVGSVVTVRGIVLNGDELGPVRYLQDSTAGIALYPGGNPPSSFEQVTRGDRIQVTGVLSLYHGLLEVNPILSYQKLSSGEPLPDPVEKDPGALKFEDQGMLIRVPCARFHHAPGTFEAGQHSLYTEKGSKTHLYLEGTHPLIGGALPDEPVELIAIASFYDDPRVLIRSSEDILPAPCFHILPVPEQSMITEDGFRLDWRSSLVGRGIVVVASETGETDTVIGDITHMHTVDITALEDAEFYTVHVGAIDGQGDTAWYSPLYLSTRSTSSGEIQIYFNQPVDETYSNGSLPDGVGFSAMITSILDLIENAQQSIDIAMYNSNRPDIINALEEAQDRGVRIRYIGDGGQSNSALDPLPDFPLLFRNGDGIMHHKFLVADPHDAAAAKVWTGSTNHSTNQIGSDPNNALVIRDQALAKAYQMEFEEMWGGSGDFPNPLTSRTGSAKRDNTPHLFQIGDKIIECYFSPSDFTNSEIRSELENAEERIDVALLLLTRNDLTSSLISRFQEGVDVRLIIDDRESSLDLIDALQDAGIQVAHHDFNSIFHHKYAILDEGFPAARVITGSHNWTTSATTRNDENTLIIHDGSIANIFRQEYEARWHEVYPTSVKDVSGRSIHVFPNPASNVLYLSGTDPVKVQGYTMHGTPVFLEMEAGMIDIDGLPSGTYVLSLQLKGGSVTHLPFVKH